MKLRSHRSATKEITPASRIHSTQRGIFQFKASCGRVQNIDLNLISALTSHLRWSWKQRHSTMIAIARLSRLDWRSSICGGRWSQVWERALSISGRVIEMCRNRRGRKHKLVRIDSYLRRSRATEEGISRRSSPSQMTRIWVAIQCCIPWVPMTVRRDRKNIWI